MFTDVARVALQLFFLKIPTLISLEGTIINCRCLLYEFLFLFFFICLILGGLCVGVVVFSKIHMTTKIHKLFNSVLVVTIWVGM